MLWLPRLTIRSSTGCRCGICHGSQGARATANDAVKETVKAIEAAGGTVEDELHKRWRWQIEHDLAAEKMVAVMQAAEKRRED